MLQDFFNLEVRCQATTFSHSRLALEPNPQNIAGRKLYITALNAVAKFAIKHLG